MKIFKHLSKAIFVLFILLFSSSISLYSINYWTGKTFSHSCVDANKLKKGVIRVKKIDETWKSFNLVELPKAFMDWNIKHRLKMLEGLKKKKRPSLEGPHSGIVATHGTRRKDSNFDLNNAIKGIGFLPRPEKIKEIIKKLKTTSKLSMTEKLDILIGFYKNYNTIFDLTKQISLELYSTPQFETQTFLNQMAYPESVIVFMGIPTFKLKCVAYLLHPENPELTDYEKNVVEYINLIHCYFHGHFKKTFIAVIYNIIEVYDSSPGKKSGRGTLLVP